MRARDEIGLLLTDAVRSLNYDGPDPGETFADAGTFLDLADGSIYSTGLFVDGATGDVAIRGSVTATAFTLLDATELEVGELVSTAIQDPNIPANSYTAAALRMLVPGLTGWTAPELEWVTDPVEVPIVSLTGAENGAWTNALPPRLVLRTDPAATRKRTVYLETGYNGSLPASASLTLDQTTTTATASLGASTFGTSAFLSISGTTGAVDVSCSSFTVNGDPARIVMSAAAVEMLNVSALILSAPYNASGEGGQLTLAGAQTDEDDPGYSDWNIDAYQGNLRFFDAGLVRMQIQTSGRIIDKNSNVLAGVESGTYTPTLVNIAIGTGGSAYLEGSYTFLGGPNPGDTGVITVTGKLKFGTSGQTFPPASFCGVRLPSGFTHKASARNLNATGQLWLGDGISQTYTGQLFYLDSTGVYFLAIDTAATYGRNRNVAPGVPFTWQAGCDITWTWTIEAFRNLV